MNEEIPQAEVNRRFGVQVTKTWTFGEVTDLVSVDIDWLDSWLSATGGGLA